MPRAKRWDELSRRQRREVRGYLRDEIAVWDHDGEMAEEMEWFADALRAALRELREPKREDWHE